MLIKKIKRVINKENIEKLKGIEDHIKEEIKNGTVTDDSLSIEKTAKAQKALIKHNRNILNGCRIKTQKKLCIIVAHIQHKRG